jgi:hypothetical protein
LKEKKAEIFLIKCPFFIGEDNKLINCLDREDVDNFGPLFTSFELGLSAKKKLQKNF